METQHKTAIVILTYNNLQYNQDCIESIRTYTAPGTYELIVVDNCSTDGTREWLLRQPGIKLRLNDYNVGFPAGCNMGVALAERGSDILLLNNDTVVTASWLDNLKACLYSADDIGAAGAVCNHDENLQGLALSYKTLEEMQELAAVNNRSDSRRWEEKAFLIGFCILIKRKVLDQIGLLDVSYSPGYVEDNDLSLRILSAGYRLMLCRDCFIHHYLGSQFRKDPDKFYPVLNRNRDLFQRKWGFRTAAFDEVKFASLRMYRESAHEPPKRILDLGCGIGVTLLKLKAEYPAAELYGVEPDAAMAHIAKRFAAVSVAPAGEFPLAFAKGSFDCILIGNALEKTQAPEALLRGLLPYLAEEGTVLGEVHNLGHYDVLKSLLRGSFLYAADALDRASRTFFARDDLFAIAERCGFRPPRLLHWYSEPAGEETPFIAALGTLAGEERTYLYRTRLFVFEMEKRQAAAPLPT